MHSTQTIGVVGAGNMGSGIAQKLAMEGLNVVLTDMAPEVIDRGIDSIRSTLDQAVSRRVCSPDQVEQTMQRIHASTDLKDLAKADMVIEAVFEDEGVKKNLLRDLDNICDQNTILATNTSSFYVRELAKATSRPDRVVGMHYFFHPAKNRLLEVVPHAGTSKETLRRSLEVGRLHAKTNIVVQDATGFCVNRFFVPFLVEACRLREDQVATIPTIDAAAKKAFGITMGPFELMNVTGIAIAVHASATFGRELGSFYQTPALLQAQLDRGTLFDLDGEVEESLFPIIEDRLYGACLGAAAALVSEGVASIEDTDRGAKIGLRWRKGPFEIMNRIGIERTCLLVEAMARRHPDFTMPEVLIRQREAGTPFSFSYVDLEIDEGIAYITLNRPEALNALNQVTMQQLDERFTAAEADPAVKAIVLRGAGKAFVAGADIRFFIKNIQQKTLDETAAFTRQGHELLLRLENSDKLTIAVLDGLSLGGGSELALACQMILATPAGSMGFPETAIGIFPGLGGMIRSARQMGTELAKYYVFTGRPLDAQDLYDLGIVDRIVPPQDLAAAIAEAAAQPRPDKYRYRELPERFTELARTCTADNVGRLLAGLPPEGVEESLAAKTLKGIGRKAPLALAKANELIDAQQRVSIPQAIELELAELHWMFSTEDALAGLLSVGGKPPEYKGK